MRHTIIGPAITGLLVLSGRFVLPSASLAQTSGSSRAAEAPAEPPIESGVYGFSGGRVPGADFPEGVVGECIWIFDEDNKKQVAKGDCAERSPGKFRVVLKPGRYVVRGPGGNKSIEIKARQWLKVESLTLLPGGP